MRIRVSIFVVLAGFASACSQMSSPSAPSAVSVPGLTSTPAPIATGATISGVVVGNVSGSQFTAAAAGLTVTVVGTSLRGPGMDLYAPWSLPETHQCFAPTE